MADCSSENRQKYRCKPWGREFIARHVQLSKSAKVRTLPNLFKSIFPAGVRALTHEELTSKLLDPANVLCGSARLKLRGGIFRAWFKCLAYHLVRVLGALFPRSAWRSISFAAVLLRCGLASNPRTIDSTNRCPWEPIFQTS